MAESKYTACRNWTYLVQDLWLRTCAAKDRFYMPCSNYRQYDWYMPMCWCLQCSLNMNHKYLRDKNVETLMLDRFHSLSSAKHLAPLGHIRSDQYHTFAWTVSHLVSPDSIGKFQKFSYVSAFHSVRLQQLMLFEMFELFGSEKRDELEIATLIKLLFFIRIEM